MTTLAGNGTALPFDLNAARRAAAAEAIKGTFQFRFGPDDRLFSIPAMDEWPLDISIRIQVGDLAGAIQGLIGEEWEQFLACKPTFGDLNRLIEAVSKWSGVDTAGNSPRLLLPGLNPT